MARTRSENSKHERIILRVTKTQKLMFQEIAKQKNISLTELILDSLVKNK